MRPIVLATDGSASAAAAAEQAVELAVEFEAPLVVVTVWDRPYTGTGYAPLPRVIDVAGATEERAPGIVEDVAVHARAADVDVESVVSRGFPVDEICSVAREHDARVIVIGSHGWGPLRRTLFGSVSQGVVRSAHCPVLVVPAAADAEADASPSAARGKPQRVSASAPMRRSDPRGTLESSQERS